MHALKGIEFLYHSLLPMGMTHSLTIRLRLGMIMNSSKEGMKIWGVNRGKRKCILGKRMVNAVWVTTGDSRSIFKRR